MALQTLTGFLTVYVRRLLRRIGAVDRQVIAQPNEAIKISLGLAEL